MKTKISAYDVTGGWSLDQYSGQKGHKIRLKTDVPSKDIKKIHWKLGKYATSCDKMPCHIFKTQFDVPGEGFVQVSVKVTAKNGQVFRCCRKLLIAPELDCEMFFEDYQIGNDTRCIDLVGAPLCAALALGDPFSGLFTNACGGACWQDCPRYEAIYTPLKGTDNIKCYGRHKIWAQGRISGGNANDTCVDLYKKDILGKCSKYPPLVRYVCIEPRDLTLQHQDNSGNNGNCTTRIYTIDGLSQHMFKKPSKINWRVVKNGCLIQKRQTTCKSLSVKIPANCSPSDYKVTAQVIVPMCVAIKLNSCNNLVETVRLDGYWQPAQSQQPEQPAPEPLQPEPASESEEESGEEAPVPAPAP